MNPSADLCVVVATHNRPQDLRRCLTALSKMTREVQVIVIDSASTPLVTETMAAEGWSELPSQLTIIRSDEPGVSLARNLGVKACDSPLIAFIDDDSFVHPDWADRMIAAFASTDAALVGGACLAAFDGERPGWLSDNLLQIAGITNFGPRARYVDSTRYYPYTANLAVRRDAFDAVGGFNPRLGRIGTTLLSGPDTAFVTAVAANGGRVWIDPSIKVDHLVQRERLQSRWYWRRFWWQGISRARMPHRRRTVVRLLVAAPIRLSAYAIRRDRIYLYRSAELAGFFAELLHLRKRSI